MQSFETQWPDEIQLINIHILRDTFLNLCQEYGASARLPD